jgi:DNA-directed RNA polymerase specialized sigma24 family protein
MSRAEEYLKQYRECLRRIQLLEERKQGIKDRLTHITAQLDGDRVQSSHPPDRFSLLVAELSDYESKIEGEEEILFREKAEIERVIDLVPDAAEQLVLQKHYIELRTFEQIAGEMDYSRSEIFYLRRRALRNVDVILEGRDEE